jgi:hypothetical protein
VLARDKRIPIDISFHVLALHPLGRDYRQDPLGFTDQLVYNTSEATMVTSRKRNKNKKIATSSGSISPLLARQKLQEIIKSNKNDKLGVLKDHEIKMMKKNSEFAREMLMLPLSIKHPDTPMTSPSRGGGKKRYSLSNLLTSSSTRVMYGPERYYDRLVIVGDDDDDYVMMMMMVVIM